MGTGINGVVLTLGAVSGLREAINTYTPMNLSYEAFRANAAKMNSSNECDTERFVESSDYHYKIIDIPGVWRKA